MPTMPTRGPTRVSDDADTVADGHTDKMRTLRVLVDEDERVGHVAVAQMHDAKADPAAHLGVRLAQNVAHGPRHARAALHLRAAGGPG